MKLLIITLLILTGLSSCFFTPNYELEELYGTWQTDDDHLGIDINRDGTAEVRLSYTTYTCDSFETTSLGNNKIKFWKDGREVYYINIRSLKNNVLNAERTGGKAVGYLKMYRMN
ncbi:MAG: hypothetical protein MK212_21625 [Saprospiraceae bacterium]|nr:hypothetical protein [Saprospiraceae bacterium]